MNTYNLDFSKSLENSNAGCSLHDDQTLLFSQCDGFTLKKLFADYCLGDSNFTSYCLCDSVGSLNDMSKICNAQYQSFEERQPSVIKLSSGGTSSTVRSRSDRTIHLQRKLAQLYYHLNNISDPSRPFVCRKSKTNSHVPRVSSRRSRYTGVFKNGLKWQAFINIHNKKTYISTYSTQEEAARAFDLMSLLLNRKKAVTNYDYYQRDIYMLLNEYSDIVDKFCS
ncbi:unnamed protein product [Moneuplotes crassus]|uniref:AP2/ERF domain-containing protein n=1 Tax=Euplotes crassus TaxID=5936 RepID=A0AAD1XXZ2_EUPCR|nr:unnamed protein product [Moneuplotes crassus]